jgi:uncharacterized membrane protein YeiH
VFVSSFTALRSACGVVACAGKLQLSSRKANLVAPTIASQAENQEHAQPPARQRVASPAGNQQDNLLLAFDMAGTLLFAIQGASAAVHANLDLLGLIVLAFSTAVGGGIIRDLLIGALPPAALRDWRYPALAFTGAAILFFLHPFVHDIPGSIMRVLDAAALSLFAIAGTRKALLYRMRPFVAILLGAITGAGGGIVRDILLAQVPRVLRVDVYATAAALFGAAVMVAALKLRLSPTLAAIIGGAACFLLRMISVWQHWNLPKVFPPLQP